MDEGLLLGRAPRSVQSLVPQLPVAWDLEPDSRLAMVYSEPRLWSVCARAPPCTRPCHSPRLRRCRPAGTWVAGNMLGESARVIASNYTPGKGRRSGPRRKPSCLMSSGYQPTLWKGGNSTGALDLIRKEQGSGAEQGLSKVALFSADTGNAMPVGFPLHTNGTE